MNEQTEWSGSPDPNDPDNYWIDDKTGERVNAKTGERTKPKKAPHPYRSTTHEEIFFHFNHLTHERFVGGTVFARYEVNMPLRLNDGWYMSVALCNRHDGFSREKGRQIARRRYFQRWNIWHGPEKPTYEQAFEVLSGVISARPT
jgi:hypothetical protein